MKTILFIFCASLFISCNNKNNIEPAIKDYSLEGAWELVSYLNYKEDGSVDTIKSSNAYKQMKMYSKTKIMWSRLRAWDSLDWFGVGDYTFKDGILTEVLDYGSHAMNSRIKDKKKFVFDITIDENTFTQVEIDSSSNPIYAENYKRVE
ncbi:hypothetical protein QLS71_002780 [Mariniflexile litorale]|uniref:Lipocalin-like domain-containing protein n=1 Tax=Mariniflexile litorale TaxID=3045158 RepID=A0AAU7EI16_9FLAO|nr:hypothetical protein [Mariniflexile sp. KMM 9835]MDQ8209943.1 hypothetical protein [Mariniflexile sp. KMM 9835]